MEQGLDHDPPYIMGFGSTSMEHHVHHPYSIKDRIPTLSSLIIIFIIIIVIKF